MKLFLIGHPVAHSISPQIHNAALRALGLPETYAALDVLPSRVADSLASFRQPDVGGCNVTVPHKQAVIPFLDELAPEAARIGAVNTIVQRDGRLLGFNTDASGFLAALGVGGWSGLEVGGWRLDPTSNLQPGPTSNLRGSRVVLLGAGGAARAIAFALADAGVASLSILNRDAARAAALAEQVRAAAAPAGQVESGGLDPDTLAARLAGAQLVVQATTVGMHGDESLVPPGLIPSGSVVCDIIYNPPETALLRHARAAGARAINGLGMLVHQAAAAFTLWTERPAPLPAMYQAATQALEQLRARA